MEVSTPEDYHDHFDPASYLHTHFREVKALHQFEGLHEFYSSGTNAGKPKLKILEIGCGPVIAYQISAAPHASEIVMADIS